MLMDLDGNEKDYQQNVPNQPISPENRWGEQ